MEKLPTDVLFCLTAVKNENLVIVKLPVLSYDKSWELVRGITLTPSTKQVRSLPTVASFNKALIPQLGYFQIKFRSLVCKACTVWGVSPAPPFSLSEKYAEKLCCSFAVTLMFMKIAGTSFLEIKP